MRLEAPKVSVIMPAYNAERFIRLAVDSILAQTFVDFELIILNDGSTDSTQSIVEAYTDPRIRIFNKKNSGVASTLNLGLEVARGEFIWRHDADDISLPEKLERQVIFLESHPEFILCATQIAFMTERGQVAWNKRQPMSNWLGASEYQEVFFEDFSPYSPITHATVLCKRESLVKCRGYRTAFKTAEDIDMWLRLLENGRLAVLNYCDYLVRLSSSSATAVYGWKNPFYRELAKEFYRVRQNGEQDELERTGRILEPPPPREGETKAPEQGKLLRNDLLSFNYAVHLDAKDWWEVARIIRLALRDGWKLRATYRNIVFPLLPEWFVGLGVKLKSGLK